MARIRTVKPEFFKHYELFLAEKKYKLPLRVAYSGLWTCADKEGRFKWQSKSLKLDILPWDDIDFECVLNALHDEGFIKKYKVELKYYGVIPTLKDHQRFTGTEASAASKLPEPTDDNMIKETLWKHFGNTLADWKGKEGEGTSLLISEELDNSKKLEEINTDKDGKFENENLWNVYNKTVHQVKEIYRMPLSKNGFDKWKQFVDFLITKNLISVFDFRILPPHEFEELWETKKFTEDIWEAVISKILSTGIKPEHNLFFRIPEFIKYAEPKTGYIHQHTGGVTTNFAAGGRKKL